MGEGRIAETLVGSAGGPPRTTPFRLLAGRLTDVDCSSTAPAALYGCGTGGDGAPYRSVGEFGTVPAVELGLGYASGPARFELLVEFRPHFAFGGRANFLAPGTREEVRAKLSSVSGMLAGFVDLAGLGLPKPGPFAPFVGAGVGVVHTRIGKTTMTFPATTTTVAIPGMEAIGEFMNSDVFDTMIEIPWETFEEQVAVALAEGLALESPPAAGLIAVALACGMWELRPRAMTAGDWLSELDPNDEIGALPAPVREELVGGSAAWPEDYRVVKGWSEGTAVLQEAREEADGADRAMAGFFARLESRREDWALRMLRSAHVLKGAGNVDWRTFGGTAKSVLDGRALETIPIMEHVWQRTNRDLAIEELRSG